ncbi:MAG: hypothetical protein AAFV19_07425 [Pseudomonadota bacterium]
MLRTLAWCGARAQWILALGVLSALVLPVPGALLEGTLPILVATLIGLAMTRIDLFAVARRMLNPLRLVRNLAICGLLMLVTPALFWWAASLAELPPGQIEALVYTSAGPPLGSAAAFCLLLGLDAAFALEITVLGSFLAPITMPVVARTLLGEAVPIDAAEMAFRLTVLIGSAVAGALFARHLLGADWITRQSRAFDGLSAIIMVLFLFPLFLGLPEEILAAPVFAAGTLALAIAANLGVQIVAFLGLRSFAGRESGGATAVIWGNRNAALALAALPEAPVLTLYVALYQFPMYFTPLVMRHIVGDAGREK